MDININFLSEKEVTNIFGVTTNTVAKWRMANNKGPKLPFIKLGRSIAYRREAVPYLNGFWITNIQQLKRQRKANS